ncbi:MAG: XTP/dITP diphosphatase [Candidatus Micrarchaeota archaeon]|nr:XTP/dITP diphosphatase [Candidatus Micrarchaeota archaeon]
MALLFLTSNKYKILEAKKILNKFGINFISKNSKGFEIQSDSLEKVATYCALEGFKKFKKPVFVEDSGLFINSLKGFPGVYSSYVLKTVGCEGILNLLGQKRQRDAKFICIVAFATKDEVKLFKGEVKGKISTKIEKAKGFGYDPIFIPQGYSQPFSKIIQTKFEISHRAIAFKKFAKYLLKKGVS